LEEFMIVVLNKDIVKNLLVQEQFFNEVPEYFFLKDAGSQISQALDDKGGCSSCTEKNLIEPAINSFISHTVNMRLDCGAESTIKFKHFLRKAFQQEDIVVKVLYKPDENSEIEELEL